MIQFSSELLVKEVSRKRYEILDVKEEKLLIPQDT